MQFLGRQGNFRLGGWKVDEVDSLLVLHQWRVHLTRGGLACRWLPSHSSGSI